jgi:WD40 repeat protein
MPGSSTSYPQIGVLLPLWLLLLVACGGDGPAEPSTGDLRVVVTTIGADPDGDGYLVSLDGGTPQRVASTAEATLSDLAPGAHQIAVSEIASNCTLQGDNPRAVQVEAGQVADAAVTVTCAAQQGTLRIDVTSTGWDVDADGYQVLIDGVAAGPVGSSGTVTLAAIPAGTHTVTLAGVAPNCALTVPRLREITVGFAQEAAVAFQASCALASGETAEQILLGDGRIIRVQSNGSGATYLTSDQVYADDPAWSPGRDNIAYEQNPLPLDAFDSRVWGILSAGPTPVQLTDTRSDGDPSWSPDGSRLVIRNLGETPGLVTVNADGGDRRPITDGTQDEAPAWSPDGTRIVFTRFGAAFGFGTLYLVHPDGSGITPIPTPSVYTPFGASWSPDGTRIAFTGAENGTGTGLWVMNDNGSGQVRLTTPDVTVYGVSWSPTGDRLAFAGVRGVERGLFTIRPDGAELTFRYATLESSVSWAR